MRSTDDLPQDIDTLVYDYYGLNAHDLALVEDSFTQLSDVFEEPISFYASTNDEMGYDRVC